MVYRHLRQKGIRTRFLLLFAITMLWWLPKQNSAQNPVIVGHDKDAIHLTAGESKESLIGERLFYGLAPFEAGTFNCESCHAISTAPEINWNPSAYDLALWIKNKKDAAVKKAFDMPTSQKMEETHKNMSVTDSELKSLRAYLAVVAEAGITQHKDFPTKLVLFFIFGVLMAAALIDLIFTRKIKNRYIHATILLTGLCFHLILAMEESKSLGRTKNYAPDQPIKFSHKVHAGYNKIDCKYCHSGVFNAKSAGIPSLNLCLNCHNVVKNGRNSGKFEINKIETAIKEKKPVEWIRIHSLPEHVYFNHAQHVSVGKVACQTCHGPVETMDIMKQYSELSMGWCINCHRTTKVNIDNPYYHSYKKLQEEIKAGRVKRVTVETIGGLDCMKCHY